MKIYKSIYFDTLYIKSVRLINKNYAGFFSTVYYKNIREGPIFFIIFKNICCKMRRKYLTFFEPDLMS